MRKCPTCQATYTDESLKFCLTDGSALYIPNTEEATQVFNQPIQTHQPIQIPIAQQTMQSQFQPNTQSFQPQTQKSSGNGFLYAIIGGLIVILLLGIVGVAGWFLLGSQKNNSVATVTNTNTATATPITTPTESIPTTPTPDETANLKQKVNDLQKQLNQQKQQTGKNNVPITGDESTVSTPPKSNETFAKANSPSDGFLALRTGPSATEGERILKIPHGATIKVLSCLKRAAGKNGRWCRVDYNGNFGWAFDAFMIYQ
jgi:hypothetical protein